MIISSLQNEKVKELVRLRDDSKQRRAAGLAIIEGEKFVREAVLAGLASEVFVSQTYEGRHKKESEGATLFSDAVFKKVSNETAPQGILATIKIGGLQCGLQPSGSFLVLDHVQDPSNLGAILRSSAAFGFLSIYLLGCVDMFNSKAIAASAGNFFKVRHRIISENEIPTGKNIELLALDMNGISLKNFQPDTGKICGIVIGSEGQGVSASVQQLCKQTLSIPMQNDVESLNAAVAASIVMSHFAFQN